MALVSLQRPIVAGAGEHGLKGHELVHRHAEGLGALQKKRSALDFRSAHPFLRPF